MTSFLCTVYNDPAQCQCTYILTVIFARIKAILHSF